ncbi:MAG: aspartate 1-decarboxylase [Chloroflexi bacterium]|nr:aspartate 1-decarboxylase [Chloroflexota bacterium]
MRTMLKSKIHRATVTQADINYEGSITIDKELMEAADLLPYEMVHVLDVNNGVRLTTYTIEGEPGSREIGINGAAARLVHCGDTVIILSYHELDEQAARRTQPRLVYVDASNRIVDIKAFAPPPEPESGVEGRFPATV